jgi:hypothetical protein
MKDDKRHFLLIDEVKMRPKKKCEAENRKTQILLQATIWVKIEMKILTR